MRTFIFTLYVASFAWLHTYSQPCQQEQPKNQQRSDLLEGFIWQAQQAKLMTEERGIVHLIQGADSLGQELWTLTAHMDDFYQEAKSLPRSYYKVKGYTVLIWKEKYGQQPLDSLQRQQLLDCLKATVGNKVNTKLPVEEQWEWITDYDELGNPKLDDNRKVIKRRVKVRQSISNRTSGITQFVFGKDGSVKRYFPIG